MSAVSKSLAPAPDVMEAAANQRIAACAADACEAVKAVIVANGFLGEADRGAQPVVSTNSRGRYDVPHDGKDWYDLR